MAPYRRFPALSSGSDLPYDSKSVVQRGRFWRWFLAGTLLNACISSVVIGLAVYCVQMELESIRGNKGIDLRYGPSEIASSRRLERDVGDPVSEPQTDEVHDVYPSITTPSGGAIYTRWGRTTCPNRTDTEEVYAGIGAGAYYTNTGGSVDFFCLPNNPDWSDTYNDAQTTGSYLYGMEYEISFDPFSHENAEFLHNRDVPCAVCRLMTRSTQMLYPAKLGCPEKWTKEYRGFLMSGYHTHAQRSKAVCVDQAPEAVPGSVNDDNGALLYLVEGACGSLLCPPYVGGREITCTVCSI